MRKKYSTTGNDGYSPSNPKSSIGLGLSLPPLGFLPGTQPATDGKEKTN
jgi:hypothetical protein